MNIPGFTAEASLYNVSTRYQATAEASFHGDLSNLLALVCCPTLVGRRCRSFPLNCSTRIGRFGA